MKSNLKTARARMAREKLAIDEICLPINDRLDYMYERIHELCMEGIVNSISGRSTLRRETIREWGLKDSRYTAAKYRARLDIWEACLKGELYITTP